MNCTIEQLLALLGPDATQEDGEDYVIFLEEQGWDIDFIDGQLKPSRDGEFMTEVEWQKSLKEFCDKQRETQTLRDAEISQCLGLVDPGQQDEGELQTLADVSVVSV